MREADTYSFARLSHTYTRAHKHTHRARAVRAPSYTPVAQTHAQNFYLELLTYLSGGTVAHSASGREVENAGREEGTPRLVYRLQLRDDDSRARDLETRRARLSPLLAALALLGAHDASES